MNQQIIHDLSRAAAFKLLHAVAGCLREEEHQVAFTEFYLVVKDALDSYAQEYDRLLRNHYGAGMN